MAYALIAVIPNMSIEDCVTWNPIITSRAEEYRYLALTPLTPKIHPFQLYIHEKKCPVSHTHGPKRKALISLFLSPLLVPSIFSPLSLIEFLSHTLRFPDIRSRTCLFFTIAKFGVSRIFLVVVLCSLRPGSACLGPCPRAVHECC